jgi:nicotinate-nucleotide adenylyltransferase
MQYLENLNGGIGILGGTFDPIHLAHVEVCRIVKEKYNLSAIAAIPAFQNPLREHEQILAPTEDRLVMAYMATMEYDWLFVDPIEIERGRRHPDPSYTIETLYTYRTRFPHVAITLIVGADNVDLDRWKSVDEFASLLARIVAVARPDYEEKFRSDLEVARANHPVVADMVEFLPDVALTHSSTEVRENLRKGHVPEEMLNPNVAHHIAKYGLYGCREACEV